MPVNAWGYGAAKIVPRSTKEATERVAFLPDIHVPYHDQTLLDSALRLIKRFAPHRVVFLGDLCDFHSISRWNTSQERLDDLQADIDLGVEVLRSVRKAAPDAALDLTMGNHDERLRRFVYEKGRALASLRSLDFRVLIDADSIGLRVHEGCGFLLRPHFLVRHGTMIRRGAGNSAKAEAQAAGINGISGHTHRLATYRVAGYGSVRWTEAGTLSRVDPPYTLGVPDHQQGMALGHFSSRSGTFIVEEIQEHEGKLWYGGKAA